MSRVEDRTAAPRGRVPDRAAVGQPSGFWALLVLVGILNVVGLVMVLSASSVQAASESGSTWSIFARQALWLALGVIALCVTVRIPFKVWGRVAGPLLCASGALLLLVLVPGFGVEVNGARSWLGSDTVRFQPAELAKLAILFYAADLLARRRARMADWRLTLLPVMVVFGGLAMLLMLQPDLGTLLATSIIVFSVLFVAGVPLGPLTTVLAGGGAGLAMLLALAAPYRRNRLLAFLNPEADPLNVGYQSFQSLLAVSSGGLFGVGLGASRAKYGFLPNAHTDFIYAIICEELGMIGGLLVLALLVGVGVFGVRAAMRAPDRFGMLLASGITAWILGQALINIGAVVGLLPITGIPLPFVSFGGSSLTVLMFATGILLNVARNGRDPSGPDGVAAARRRAAGGGSMTA